MPKSSVRKCQKCQKSSSKRIFGIQWRGQIKNFLYKIPTNQIIGKVKKFDAGSIDNLHVCPRYVSRLGERLILLLFLISNLFS